MKINGDKEAGKGYHDLLLSRLESTDPWLI